MSPGQCHSIPYNDHGTVPGTVSDRATLEGSFPIFVDMERLLKTSKKAGRLYVPFPELVSLTVSDWECLKRI